VFVVADLITSNKMSFDNGAQLLRAFGEFNAANGASAPRPPAIGMVTAGPGRQSREGERARRP
jgi:hypothetical protein